MLRLVLICSWRLARCRGDCPSIAKPQYLIHDHLISGMQASSHDPIGAVPGAYGDSDLFGFSIAGRVYGISAVRFLNDGALRHEETAVFHACLQFQTNILARKKAAGVFTPGAHLTRAERGSHRLLDVV